MRGRGIEIIAAVLIVSVVLLGCTTIRRVDRGEVDELVSPPPQEWAVQNAQVDDTGEYTYFVGISQEQAPSEEAAIQQAYLDGIRRLSDSIGFWLSGADGLHTDADTDASDAYPHRIKGRKARKWSRKGGGAWSDEAKNIIVRDQIIGKAQIADTWVVRETFHGAPPRLNLMKYGELWKAKVLIRIASGELAERADQEYEIRMAEVDMQFEPYEEPEMPSPTFSFMAPGYVAGVKPPEKPGTKKPGTHFISYGTTDAPAITVFKTETKKGKRSVVHARGMK